MYADRNAGVGVMGRATIAGVAVLIAAISAAESSPSMHNWTLTPLIRFGSRIPSSMRYSGMTAPMVRFDFRSGLTNPMTPMVGLKSIGRKFEVCKA